ncbi:MAG: SbtA family thio(seleno)oxazole RiPP natural product precursor [Desulfuromonas sp.]
MRDNEMKKILAGLGIATLMSAVGVSLPAQVHAGSG